MYRWFFCLFTIITSESIVSAAGVFPQPLTYTKPVGTEFLFVQHGDLEAEAKVGTPSQRQSFQELRSAYPKPGLYRVADRSLVWEAPVELFTPYDLTLLSDDGEYLVRIEGEFWKTEAFPGGARPGEEKQAQQLQATALSFWHREQLIKSWRLNELIEAPHLLMHSPEHLIWLASGSFNATKDRVIIFTQEPRRLTFDLKTGELISVEPVGLDNPWLVTILIAFGTMSSMIFLGWLIFILKNNRPSYSQ